MPDDPDYSRYTIDELHDARRHVDAARYPERAAAIEAEIHVREPAPHEEPKEKGGDAGTITSTRPQPIDRWDRPSQDPEPSVAWSRRLASHGDIGRVAHGSRVLGGRRSADRLLRWPRGGAAGGCSVLWGERYRVVVVGIVFVWVGLLAGLMGAVGLMLTLSPEFLVPGGDNPMDRRMALGSAMSAVLLVGTGAVILVARLRRRPESNGSRG